MESEMLKLIGNGGSQIILAAGYIPMFWVIKALWAKCDALGDKILSMLALQYADADKRKELWDAQTKVIDGQTTVIKDQVRTIDSQTVAIKDLTREVREGLQRIRP